MEKRAFIFVFCFTLVAQQGLFGSKAGLIHQECMRSVTSKKQELVHEAVAYMNVELKKSLRSSEYNASALHSAAFRGEVAELDKELNSDVDINLQTESSGKTALHLAVMQKKYEVVVCLLFCKANLAIADERGYTPLHYAVVQQDKMMVRFLLQAAANKDQLSNQGVSAYDIAQYLKNEEIIALFETIALAPVPRKKQKVILVPAIKKVSKDQDSYAASKAVIQGVALVSMIFLIANAYEPFEEDYLF